jgi:predicted LPLAT superfamily acyltransferase
VQQTDGMSATSAISAVPPQRVRESGGVSTWQRISFGLAHRMTGFLFAVLGLHGLYEFGRCFGTIEWLINYRRRRRFRRVLREVLDHEPDRATLRRITRDYFATSRCDKLFYLVFDRIPRETAAGLVHITNRVALDAAAARGRGVYTGLAHHGPHHVMGLLLPLLGYRVAGVRDSNEGGLRRFVQARFDRKYPEFNRGRVLYSDSFPREIIRTLQEGYILGSAMDVARVRDGNQKSEEVAVFGGKRRFLTGPLWIAVRCRVPVLQAFIIPERDFQYRLDVLEIMADPESVSDEAEAVSRCIAAYAANVEAYTRKYPSLLTRV